MPSAFQIKQHLLAVYIITFYYFHAIKNLGKFIFVKITSKQKIPKKEGNGLRQNWAHQTELQKGGQLQKGCSVIVWPFMTTICGNNNISTEKYKRKSYSKTNYHSIKTLGQMHKTDTNGAEVTSRVL